MINKKVVMGIISAVIAMSLQLTAFAGEVPMDARAQEIEKVNSFVSENVSRIVGTPRGMLISSVELMISDLGGGTVELYGDVLCHKPMEKIKLNMYLDKWVSENSDWSQINKYELTWLAEDYPDELLTMAMGKVKVPNLERGIDYRLRGIAGAWDLDSNLYEVFRADTASILVE